MEATCRDGSVSMAHQDGRLIDSIFFSAVYVSLSPAAKS